MEKRGRGRPVGSRGKDNLVERNVRITSRQDLFLRTLNRGEASKLIRTALDVAIGGGKKWK
jgi:hypothetical protein